MWRATVLTLFPEMFPGPLGISLAGKALATGIWSLESRDIRNSATDRHRSVDDTPAGGGPGMVLRADVLAKAIDQSDISPDRPRLLMSPRGRPLTQSRVSGTGGRARAADRLRTIRRGRPAGHRGPRARGSLDRRLCAVRGRNRGDGADRRLRPAFAGGDGQGGIGRRTKVFRTDFWNIPNTRARRSSRAARSRTILLSGDHAKVAAWRRVERRKRLRRPAVPTSGQQGTIKIRQKTRRTGDNAPALPYRSAKSAQRAFSGKVESGLPLENALAH